MIQNHIKIYHIKNFDLIQDVTTKKSNIQNIQVEWIKAHQDDKQKYDTLSRPAQLNVLADNLAKQEWKKQCDKGNMTIEPMVNTKFPAVYIDQRFVTTFATKSLYQLITKKMAIQYWEARLSWNKVTQTFVSWNSLNQSMQQLNYHQKIGMIKMASGHLAVAHKLKQWNMKKDDSCPFCKQKETVDHKFQCSDNRAKTFRESQINLFITHLKVRRTNPTITKAIQQHLINWCNLKEEIPNGSSPSWYAVTEQSAIGWRQFFCGKISTKWTDLQQKFWKQRNINKSSFLWSVELINRIWKVAWEIWNFRCSFAFSLDSEWDISFKQELQDKIIYEYNKGPDGAKGLDKRWWENSLEKISKKSPEQQELLLLSVEIVQHKIARKKNTLAKQRRIMWNWIHNC